MLALWALLAALPPIKTVQDAQAQLALKSATQQVEALENLETACRSSVRLALRDQPPLVARARQLAKEGTAEVKRGVIDAGRCFSPKVFSELLVIQLADQDPAVVSYAAEGAARIADPVLAPPLLDAFDQRKLACKTKGLAPAEVERCTWLTYAPGAVLAGADRPLRERAAKAAVEMLEAPYAKVREVAVETLAAAKLKAHAPALGEMIDREQKQQLEAPNAPALIVRFRQRLAELKKGD